jgi:hypothetical protein
MAGSMVMFDFGCGFQDASSGLGCDGEMKGGLKLLIAQMAMIPLFRSMGLLPNSATLISLLRLWTHNRPFLDFPRLSYDICDTA